MRTSLIAGCVLLFVVAVMGDCGCLQCSKNLKVVSSPSSPIKVIYRGSPCHCPRQISYTVETPVIKQNPCRLRNYCYKMLPIELTKPVRPVQLYSHDYQVQVPTQNCKPINYLVGLVAAPDRIVLPAQDCASPPPCGCPKTTTFESVASLDDDNVYLPPFKTCTRCTRYVRYKRNVKDKPNADYFSFKRCKRNVKEKESCVSCEGRLNDRGSFLENKNQNKCAGEECKKEIPGNHERSVEKSYQKCRRNGQVNQASLNGGVCENCGRFTDESRRNVQENHLGYTKKKCANKNQNLQVDKGNNKHENMFLEKCSDKDANHGCMCNDSKFSPSERCTRKFDGNQANIATKLSTNCAKNIGINEQEFLEESHVKGNGETSEEKYKIIHKNRARFTRAACDKCRRISQPKRYSLPIKHCKTCRKKFQGTKGRFIRETCETCRKKIQENQNRCIKENWGRSTQNDDNNGDTVECRCSRRCTRNIKQSKIETEEQGFNISRHPEMKDVKEEFDRNMERETQNLGCKCEEVLYATISRGEGGQDNLKNNISQRSRDEDSQRRVINTTPKDNTSEPQKPKGSSVSNYQPPINNSTVETTSSPADQVECVNTVKPENQSPYSQSLYVSQTLISQIGHTSSSLPNKLEETMSSSNNGAEGTSIEEKCQSGGLYVRVTSEGIKHAEQDDDPKCGNHNHLHQHATDGSCIKESSENNKHFGFPLYEDLSVTKTNIHTSNQNPKSKTTKISPPLVIDGIVTEENTNSAQKHVENVCPLGDMSENKSHECQRQKSENIALEASTNYQNLVDLKNDKENITVEEVDAKSKPNSSTLYEKPNSYSVPSLTLSIESSAEGNNDYSVYGNKPLNFNINISSLEKKPSKHVNSIGGVENNRNAPVIEYNPSNYNKATVMGGNALKSNNEPSSLEHLPSHRKYNAPVYEDKPSNHNRNIASSKDKYSRHKKTPAAVTEITTNNQNLRLSNILPFKLPRKSEDKSNHLKYLWPELLPQRFDEQNLKIQKSSASDYQHPHNSNSEFILPRLDDLSAAVKYSDFRRKRGYKTIEEENVEKNIREIFFNDYSHEDEKIEKRKVLKLPKIRPLFRLPLGKRTKRNMSKDLSAAKKIRVQNEDPKEPISGSNEAGSLQSKSICDSPEHSGNNNSARETSNHGSRRKKRDYSEIYQVRGESSVKPSDIFYDTINWDDIIPQIPLFFFINAPVRMLRHFDKLKNHLEPVVHCVPTVIDTSRRYFQDFGRKFKRSAVDFANNIFGGFTRSTLDDDFLDIADNSPIFGRISKRSLGVNPDSIKLSNEGKYYAKKINQDNLEDFLEIIDSKMNPTGGVNILVRNKNIKTGDLVLIYENYSLPDEEVYLGRKDIDDGKYQNVFDGIDLKSDYLQPEENGVDNEIPELRIASIRPQLVSAHNIKDMLGDGIKTSQPLDLIKNANFQQDKSLANNMKHHRVKRSLLKVIKDGEILDILRERFSLSDNENIDSPGEDIFEKHFNSIPKLRAHYEKPDQLNVVLQKFNPNTFLKSKPETSDDAFSILRSKHDEVHNFNPETNLQVIKNEITRILETIHLLIHTDFSQDIKILNSLLKLQIMKDNLTADWKKTLLEGKEQDSKIKLKILHYIQELMRYKKAVMHSIVQQLQHRNGYNRKNLIDTLIQLFKIQLVFTNIAEDFSEKIKTGAKFNPTNEASYIAHLNRIKILEISKAEIETSLKTTRDNQLQKQMQILEKLKTVLDHNDLDDDHRDMINQKALLIRENLKLVKLQKTAIRELNSRSQNLRRKLKSVHDLQTHIDENMEELLGKEDEVEEEVVGEEDKTKSSLKEKLDEFIKSFEAKRDAWLEKNKINITWKPLV